MRLLLTFMVVLLGVCGASAANDYDVLATRAQRYYDLAEWTHAGTMYDLMLEERPQVVDTYGHAIVTAAMRADSLDQLRLFDQALAHAVPFDSLFASVRGNAVRLGQARVYPAFLLSVKARHPYLARPVERNLLAYYMGRHDAGGIIQYASILLKGLPDDIALLTILAQAQTQAGLTQDATATYQRMLAIDKANVDALIGLGMILRVAGDPEADQYLLRARAVAPSPYLDRLLGPEEGAK